MLQAYKVVDQLIKSRTSKVYAANKNMALSIGASNLKTTNVKAIKIRLKKKASRKR